MKTKSHEKPIEILDTFKYSVNIKNDYFNPKKINAYIPTEKNIILIEKYMNSIIGSSSKSFLLSGAYGTGKSFLVSVVLGILSGKLKSNDIKLFLDKSSKVASDNSKLETYIKKQKWLVVFPEDIFSDFSQAIVLGIIKTAEENEIKIHFKTSYNLILQKIAKWEKSNSDTITSFKKHLLKNGIDYRKFKREIANFNKKYYLIFERIYSQIMGGERFIPLGSINRIDEILCEFENLAIKEGYDGVVYCFDEFGRYLEQNIGNIDVKQVQDMAEYCNSESKSALFLISHKDLFQYSKRLKDNDQIHEWEKVNGRFLKEHLIYEENNILNIIKIILSKSKAFNEFVKRHETFFSNQVNLLVNSNLITDQKENAQIIIKQLYPLNYLTALILPDFSQKLAQNERTLFAFLCGDEPGSLKNIFNNSYNTVDNITPDRLYDYFENNFKFLDLESAEYKIYINAKNILTKLSNEVEKKIIKIITVIYIYNKFSHIAPVYEIIKYGVDSSSVEFEKALSSLIKRKSIIFRRHYGHYKLLEDIDINVDEDVKKYIKNHLDSFDPVQTLTNKIPLGYEYPYIYNEKYNIIRYFKNYYIDSSNMIKMDEVIKDKVEDGKIVYLMDLENSNANIKKLLEIYGNQAVFVVNKHKKYDIIEYIKQIEAIERMFNTDEKYRTGILKNEILSYQNELINLVEKKITSIFEINSQIDIYIDGNKKKISDKSEFIDILSQYLEKKYYKFVPLNYELINKTNLSVQMKRCRADILNKLRLKAINNEYFNDTGAENSVARIVLEKNSIYNSKNKSLEFDKSPLSDLYHDVLTDIKNNKVLLSDLYDKYASNKSKYGFRKGIFSFYLMLIVEKHIEEIVISTVKGNEEIDFNPDYFEKIEGNLEEYQISYIKYSKNEKMFLDAIAEKFKFYLDLTLFKQRKTLAIFKAFKSYILSLPQLILTEKYTRKNRMQKVFYGILSINNSKEFLFKNLPEIYDVKDIKKLSRVFLKDANEINENYFLLKRKIEKAILRYLNVSDTNFKSGLSKWRKKAKKEKLDNLLTWLYERTSEKHFDPEDILLGITELLKGFDYKNWKSYNDYSDFIDLLNKKRQISDTTNKNVAKLQYKGQKYLFFVKHIEENKFSKLLKSKLEADIKNIGSSITKEEKNSILIEILRKDN